MDSPTAPNATAPNATGPNATGPGPGPTTNIAPGATPAAGPASAPVGSASRIALDFLSAMERRDLDAAGRLIAPDFAMCFPGGHRMHRLEELVTRSGGRYRHVAKRFERVEEAPGDRGVAVYCAGVLFGEWADGSRFDDIRFIDRIEVVDGKVWRQDVWNDAAYSRPIVAASQPRP